MDGALGIGVTRLVGHIVGVSEMDYYHQRVICDGRGMTRRIRRLKGMIKSRRQVVGWYGRTVGGGRAFMVCCRRGVGVGVLE